MVVYLEQVPSALQVFREKRPPFPHRVPTALAPPGVQVNCLAALFLVHLGLFVHWLVAFPQIDLTRRLVQKEVQHLVLGTAKPASHSSPVSTTPFPQTIGTTDTPDDGIVGGWTTVGFAELRGLDSEGVLDGETDVVSEAEGGIPEAEIETPGLEALATGLEALTETPAGDEALTEAAAGDEALTETPAGDEALTETPAGDEALTETPAGDEALTETPAGDVAFTVAFAVIPAGDVAFAVAFADAFTETLILTDPENVEFVHWNLATRLNPLSATIKKVPGKSSEKKNPCRITKI